MIARRLLLVPLLALLAACGSEDPTGLNPGTAPMTAEIDGESWIASFATVSQAGGQVFVNAAAPDMSAIGFQFPNDGTPATYTLGPGVLASVGVTRPGNAWLAGITEGSGSITITLFESDRLEGTFSFVVVGGPTPPSLNVTNGRFVIDY